MFVHITLAGQQGKGTIAQRKALIDAIFAVVGHSTAVSNALSALGQTIADVSIADRVIGYVGSDVHATNPPSFPSVGDVATS